jgi:PmbA protein
MSSLSIYDLGLLALREAIRRGADEAEVYIVKTKSIEATIQNNKLSGASTIRDGGIGLRVAIGKKIGFSATNKLESLILTSIADKAVSIAKASREDPDWKGFPQPQKYVVPKNIFSSQLAEADEESVLEKAELLMENILRDKRIKIIYGTISVTKTSIAVLNTNGLMNIQHLTSSIVVAETVANEAGYTTPVVAEIDHSRTSFPNIKKLADKLVEETLSCLKPVGFEPGYYPVILETPALESLFTYTLFRALSGDNIVRGRSPYKDKIGELVASEKLTLIDDGLYNQGLFTAIFDDEGIPMSTKTLIKNGVLKGFLFNYYWALKYNTESTGNARRRSYNSTPSISPTNIIIESGDASIEEIIRETKKGLIVKDFQGAHSSNPETGEYSVVATPAWAIINGELKPVKNVMISGKIYDDLKRIDMIGNETYKWIHLWSPIIRFENIRVVSR